MVDILARRNYGPGLLLVAVSYESCCATREEQQAHVNAGRAIRRSGRRGMSTSAMATYVCDQIDRTRTELNAVSK
jgi:hypothetical protein